MPKLNWDGNDFRNSQDSSGTVADNISRNGNLQQGYEHGSLTRGLVAYYPMEKGQGEILHDGALDNLGQIKGVTWESIGPVGGDALSFDGTDDEVDISEAPISEPATLTAWVKLDSLASSNGENSLQLIGDSNYSLRLDQYDNTSKYGFTEYGVSDYTFNVSTVTGEWTHLAWVMDSNEARFYLNGLHKDSNSSTVPIPRNKITSRGPIKTTDIRIYDRALSQTEITTLSNINQTSGVERNEDDVPGQSEGGISRYKLDGDATDSWGDNNGTNNGADLTATGVYGQAGDFSGSGEYIDVSNFSSFTKYTISLWVKPRSFSDGDKEFIFQSRKNNDIQIHDNNSGEIKFHHGDGTSNQLGTPVDNNSWSHLLMTWNGSQVRAYKNGSLIGTYVTNTLDEGDRGDYIATLNGDSRFLDGKIDDVRIYNKALTPLQVEKLYHKGAYRIPRESTLQ